MSKALVINLCGAPGAGKSTGAAYIFSKLKMAGINAELSTEFAKDKLYEESKEVFNNQLYIFGKQYFKLSRMAEKVDVVVTDAPLFVSALYNNHPGKVGESLTSLILNSYFSFENLTFYLERIHDYDPRGRFQDEAGSIAKGEEIKDFLNKNVIPYIITKGDITYYDDIIRSIKRILSIMG